MREPQQLHTTNKYTGPKQAENADHTTTTCAHIDLTIDINLSQLPTTTTNPDKTITPLDASDVMMLKNFDLTPKSQILKSRMNRKPPSRKNAMRRNYPFELQITKCSSSSDRAAPTPAIELDNKMIKRRMLPTPRLPGMDPIKITYLKGLFDTYTDEQYEATIKNLPEAWQDVNEKGTVITNRLLLMAAWG